MADAKPYRRLPGTGYRRVVPGWVILALFLVIGIFALLLQGRRVQLWEGEEHLLLVEWDGNREYYKRFKYSDIQAFILRKTNESTIVSILFGVLALVLGALAFVSSDIGFRIFLLTVAGLAGLIFLVNVLRGQSCKCLIRTAVQTEELPSLTRIPRVRKVMGRLGPRIAAAQGVLAAEEIPLRMQEWAAPKPVAEGVQYVVDDPNAPPRIVS